MEFNKCSRCGNFYLSEGNVCPKCTSKDNLEFSKFKTYIDENGLNENLDIISGETGISVKNINRFLGYECFGELSNKIENINVDKNQKIGKINL